VARQRRDGGIVKAKNQSKNNPSAAFGVSSLCTREPLVVTACLSVILLLKLSLRTPRFFGGEFIFGLIILFFRS